MRIQLGQTERHKLGKPWVGFYTFTFLPYIEKATENNCLGSCCIQDWLCKWNKPQLKPQGWSIAKWEWATWSCSSRSPIGWKVFGWNVLILHIISGVRQSIISIMVGIGMYNGILIEYDHHVPIGILVLLNFNGSRVTQGSRACLAAPSTGSLPPKPTHLVSTGHVHATRPRSACCIGDGAPFAARGSRGRPTHEGPRLESVDLSHENDSSIVIMIEKYKFWNYSDIVIMIYRDIIIL